MKGARLIIWFFSYVDCFFDRIFLFNFLYLSSYCCHKPNSWRTHDWFVVLRVGSSSHSSPKHFLRHYFVSFRLPLNKDCCRGHNRFMCSSRLGTGTMRGVNGIPRSQSSHVFSLSSSCWKNVVTYSRRVSSFGRVCAALYVFCISKDSPSSFHHPPYLIGFTSSPEKH